MMEFKWGNRPCAERSDVAGLSGGVWKLARIRRKIENGRCLLCLGIQGVKTFVVDWSRNLKMEKRLD